MSHPRLIRALLLCAVLLHGAALASDPPPPDYADRLSGDWGGLRAGLRDRGWEWEIVYRLDLLGRFKSDSHPARRYWLDQLDIKLDLDADRRFGWADTRGFLHILGNHGKKPAIESKRLPHGLDNIEVPEGADSFKVFHAWLEKSFPDSGLSIKAGLYGIDSEFYVTDSSGLFIHPTYGVGAEFAGTGHNGPSIFPYSSLGLRVKYQPVTEWYIQAALMDGVPGNPDHPKSTRIDFESGDGLLGIVEYGRLWGDADAPDAKLAVGLWGYSRRFDDMLSVDADGNPLKRRSHGIYLASEATLWSAAEDPERRLRGFFRIGRNDGNTTQFTAAWSAGLVWDRVWPGGANSQFGLAYSQEHNGDKWRQSVGNGEHYERALELNYRTALRPGLWLQPFLQYLINHGNDPSQDHSWWGGLRIEASL